MLDLTKCILRKSEGAKILRLHVNALQMKFKRSYKSTSSKAKICFQRISSKKRLGFLLKHWKANIIKYCISTSPRFWASTEVQASTCWKAWRLRAQTRVYFRSERKNNWESVRRARWAFGLRFQAGLGEYVPTAVLCVAEELPAGASLPRVALLGFSRSSPCEFLENCYCWSKFFRLLHLYSNIKCTVTSFQLNLSCSGWNYSIAD